MTYSEDLQCCWTSWRAASPDTLELRMNDGNAPDMAGCIKVATFLMPGVQVIRAYSDRLRDTIYTRRGDGQWVAARPRG